MRLRLSVLLLLLASLPGPEFAGAQIPDASASPAPGISPNVAPDQVGAIPAAGTHKAIGVIQNGNSVVPFTVEAVEIKRLPDGTMHLRLALTNNSSGPLDAAGQFNSGIKDTIRAKEISGVYLADPVSHARFDVLRPTELITVCSNIATALAPGERRLLEATFADLPATVKEVYVYFPHASPISGVPVSR